MPRRTFRNIITSPETLAKVLPENRKIVERYMKNFDTKRSDKSVHVRESDLDIFLCWNCLYNENKLITEIKKYELMDFFDYGVKEMQWGTSRFYSMHSALSTLFDFIVNFLDDDYPRFVNNMGKIEKPVKTFAREKTVLTEEQVNSLIEHLRETKKQQQLTYLLLCVGSGARISETLRFTTDIIDENNVALDGFFLKTTEMIKTKGFGKSGAPKYKYIYKQCFWDDYQKWLPERAEILKAKGKKDHKMVFLNGRGDPATLDTVNGWVRQWEKFLTNDEKTNPKHKEINLYVHCLRHYLVSLLARKGIGQELIVAIFGWKSADMYNVYCDLDEDERKYKDTSKLGGVF